MRSVDERQCLTGAPRPPGHSDPFRDRHRRGTRPDTSLMWADVVSLAGTNSRLIARYVVFMTVAGVITYNGGVDANTILIVGAMAVTPDLLPITATPPDRGIPEAGGGPGELRPTDPPVRTGFPISHRRSVRRALGRSERECRGACTANGCRTRERPGLRAVSAPRWRTRHCPSQPITTA